MQFKEEYYKLKIDFEDIRNRNELLEIKLRKLDKSLIRDRSPLPTNKGQSLFPIQNLVISNNI